MDEGRCHSVHFSLLVVPLVREAFTSILTDLVSSEHVEEPMPGKMRR